MLDFQVIFFSKKKIMVHSMTAIANEILSIQFINNLDIYSFCGDGYILFYKSLFLVLSFI